MQPGRHVCSCLHALCVSFLCGRLAGAHAWNLHEEESSCRCCKVGAGRPPLCVLFPLPAPLIPAFFKCCVQVLVLEQPTAVPAERTPWTRGRDVWWGDVVPMMVSSRSSGEGVGVAHHGLESALRGPTPQRH